MENYGLRSLDMTDYPHGLELEGFYIFIEKIAPQAHGE